jgi:hypothetical protein
MKDSLTIKITSLRVQDDYPEINRIIGSIDANNFAHLIDIAGLGANPRESKSNKVTDAIIDTLEKNPKLMAFKSKGLLVSTSKCSIIWFQHVKLSFAKPYEGILDGGHNLFAIALFILKKLADDDGTRIKKVKSWTDLIILWKEKRHSITVEKLNTFSFLIPIEIIYPKEDTDQQQFFSYVAEISSARNNNTQLKESAKADYNGHYDYLKKCLSSEINDKVQWKENEANKSLKSDAIIALSLIPLYALQEALKEEKNGLFSGVPRINPAIIYGSKARCIKIFDIIIKSFLDNKEEMSDEFKSAMEMVAIMPVLFDNIQESFPDLFNKVDRLGNYCKHADTKNKYKTKFYEKEIQYTVPEGFIFPILVSLHKLMKYEKDEKKLVWQVSPEIFLKENLTDIEKLCDVIKYHGGHPDKVGKDMNAYRIMELIFMESINKKTS